MTREFYMPVNERLKETYKAMREASVKKDASMKMKKKGAKKFKRVLKEFKKGDLHSGSEMGPIVTNPKQAIAIAFSEKRRAKRKK